MLILTLYNYYRCECSSSGFCPYKDPKLVDPVLTEVGRADASGAFEIAKDLECDLIIASTLTRALETATIAWKRHWSGKKALCTDNL